MEDSKSHYSPFEIEQREWKKRQRNERLKQMLTIASPVFLLLLWEFLSRTGLIDIRFFPPPSAIVSTFFSLIASGEIASHIGISMYRIFAGFLLGVIPGVIIGLLNGALFADQAFCLANRDGAHANSDPCLATNHYHYIWYRGFVKSRDNRWKCIFSSSY